MLKRIKKAGLTVNREKSVFGKTEVKYLGVLVNRDGFRPDPEKIEPTLHFPVPKNLKQLCRFMDMASWYRKFLKDFATIAEPLTALTKKDRRSEREDAQQEAFEKIKALVSSAPVLARPTFDAQFVVQTDASDTGIGTVLLQVIDGQERVLEFASRTLSPAERNYSVTERECLAVIWTIKKFRPYLEGYRFLVVTVHSSLRWLHSLHSPTGRLARWALELQGHSFDVKHRKDERAARLYYWPKMYNSVKRYVRQCQVCQQTKAVQRPPADPIGQRVIDGPSPVVAGDIIGPFVKSKFGYEYILVFEDLFTR